MIVSFSEPFNPGGYNKRPHKRDETAGKSLRSD